MKIAFVGNPNTGKTALINAIAGSDLEVGNWPGVTVERKEAIFRYGVEEIALVDLPGAYTLSPYSLEEKITRDVLAYEPIDGIIDVVDATALRRNLYLTLELTDMGRPMVLALNMFDDFTKRGYEIDIPRLEEILGVCVVPTVGSTGLGAKRLIECAVETVRKRRIPNIQPLQSHLEKEIALLVHWLGKFAADLPYPPRLFAIKLIERDPFALELAKKKGADEIVDFAAGAAARLEKHMKLPIKTIVTRSRHEAIDAILEEVLTRPIVDKTVLSDRIDALVLHRFFSLPIFFLVMFLLFKMTFDGSAPLVAWTGRFFENYVGKYLHLFVGSRLPEWGDSLLVEGIAGGVGLVLSFLPLLFLLYFFMALLEESGYMARVSFLLDRLARTFGVKGSAFIAMIMGFGCNVPAIYATRTLTSRRERIVTALMIPLMSCSARLPIYALFTALFFSEHQVFVIMSIYLLGIVAALLIGTVADRVLPKEEEKPFFLELPAYHMPTFHAVWVLMWPRLKDFIVRAGTVIVAASMILWGVIHLPPGSDVHDSWLAKSAKTVTPLFKPLGFGEAWEPIAALIPGTIAKEVVLGSLGTIYGVETGRSRASAEANLAEDTLEQLESLKDALVKAGAGMIGILQTEEDSTESDTTLQKRLEAQFGGPLAAYSYMIFVLLYIPCISTLAAIKQEFGWKMALFETLFLPLLAYGASLLFYQTALRLFS